MSKHDNSLKRDFIAVQQYPLVVRTFTLGSEIIWSQPWAISSVVGAIVQTRANGEEHVAVREDNPFFDFQPGKLALDHVGITDPEKITMLSPQNFDEFASVYMTGVNNLNALQRAVPVIEKHVPAFQFMPSHLHYLIDADNADFMSYKHLPRMFLRYDLSEYEALVWLDRAQGQVSPKRFPALNINPDTIMHTGGAWYAFRSLEEAVGVKFMAPKTEIHRIREDV